jgi:hypothetical protein
LPPRGEAPGRCQHHPLEATPREGEAGEEPQGEVPAKQEREAPDKDRGGTEREENRGEREKRFPKDLCANSENYSDFMVKYKFHVNLKP